MGHLGKCPQKKNDRQSPQGIMIIEQRNFKAIKTNEQREKVGATSFSFFEASRTWPYAI